MTQETDDQTKSEIKAPKQDPMRSPAWLTLGALILGIAFEVLFYGHSLGISFLLWTGLCVAALLGSARLEGRSIDRVTQVLIAPMLFFAGMTFLRREPLTTFLNVSMTLALLALWVRSFRSGQLLKYGWLDFILAEVVVPLEAWIRPWPVLAQTQRQVFKEGERRQTALALVRGVLLAAPILAVFLALLTEADLVFADRVQAALQWLDLERLADLVGRVIVILLSALFFLGAMVIALRERPDEDLFGERDPLVKPFLGFTEGVIVSGSVVLLFALFVIVQFAYLFGGEANISSAGYTYAEYARRGFGELVAVGVLTLSMILSLAWVTKRKAGRQWTVFATLSAILVLEVGVILSSALKRLLLYENAYGFTRLRTYTHIFIPWMGVLLAGFLALLVLRRLRRFPIILLVVALGFGATLNLIKIDAFIVNQNAARLEQSGEVDGTYLASLSEDALPDLAAFSMDAPVETREELLPELACWQAQLEQRVAEQGWPSTHRSERRGLRALEAIEDDLAGYEIVQEEWGLWRIAFDDEPQACAQQDWRGGWD